MSSFFSTVLTVVGRVFIAAIFFMSAVGNKIPNFDGIAAYMASAGVPQPKIALVGAIVFLLAGSVSVILGYKVKFGAALLLVFLAAATYYFHPFWKFSGQEAQMQTIQFMKNLSMAGTMLFLIANGSGSASLKRD